MAFRYKPDRLKYRTTISTLDETHHKYMTNFENNKRMLPSKLKKASLLKSQLDKLNNKNSCDITADDIQRKTELRDQINKLNEEIDDITNHSSELDYYSQTTQILLEYYEAIELNMGDDFKEDDCSDDNRSNNQNSETGKEQSELNEQINISAKLVELNQQSQQKRKPKKQTKKRPKHGIEQNSKCILDFFDLKLNQLMNGSSQLDDSITSQTNSSEHTNSDEQPEQTTDKSLKKTDKYLVEQTVSNRATLFDEYMSIIDKSYNCGKKKSGIIRWCMSCNKEMTLIQSEGMFVCQHCGLVEYVIIESEVPNYKESGNEKPAYPYKRVNHLIECLNQFQAKESTEIPPEIYNEILAEIKKNKMGTTAIAFVKMKTILKKLRLNQYYEHIPHIISKITGKPAPTLTLDTEDEIKNMFKKIQEPFARHCPKDRTNFLSYSYVLHKFFQLLKMHDFLSYFPLLKSREKLRLQDKIWKNICHDLGWHFYPSI